MTAPNPAATVAFVTSPSDTPTFSQTLQPTSGTATGRVTVDGFDLGAPSFEADPYAVGGVEGWREASFTVMLNGRLLSDVATAQQGIVRQLLEPVNWLMVDLPGAKPFFLRCYKTQQQALSWQDAGAGVVSLPVTLLCDPFLYGPLQTQGPITITNDPASGANPAWYKFAAILGDAPTPLKVDLTPSSAIDDFVPAMGVYCLDTTVSNPSGPFFWQTAGFSAGTDTTMSTADAAMSGGTRTSTTFATVTTMATRFSGAAPSSLEPGRYSVFLRMARSDTTTTFAVKLGRAVGLTGSYVYGDTFSFTRTTSPSSGHATWVPLGDYMFPFSSAPLTADDAGTGSAPDISVQIQRLSGSGSAYSDVFMLIPVDTTATLMARQSRTTFFGKGIASTRNGVWDGLRLTPSMRVLTSGALTAVTAPRVDGQTDLWVFPGAASMFWLLQQTKLDDPVISAANTDSITNTTSATFSYYPRYLHMRPDTT